MRSYTIVVGTWLLAAAGCRREGMAELVAKHRAGVETTFAAIQKLAPAVGKTPKPSADRIDPPGERVVIEPQGEGNAALLYEEDLADPASQGSVAFRTLRSNTLGECGSMIRNKKTPIYYVANSFA